MKTKKNKNLPYNEVSRSLILEIHDYVISLRNKERIGQRTLARKVKRQFNINLSENTISGWIHKKVVPYANEKTQFKPKPTPPKKQLCLLYAKQKLSASKIAKQLGVSPVIVINWLKKYKIKTRSHLESMNTPKIKKELRSKALTVPKKDYSKLTFEKSYILGVLAGDGFINQKLIRFEIRKDVEFIEEFSRCLKEVYGIDYPYKYYQPRNSYVLYAVSELICKDLLKYGNFRTFSWKVPKEIFNSKDAGIIGLYLKGLYDSEGYNSKYCVSFSSSSKKGILGVQSLLSKLEINSRISCYKNQHYILNITKRENLVKFKRLVGFTIKRKARKLKW